MAATNFTLSFADDYFFEFDVHSLTHIMLHYDLPTIRWYTRLRREYAHWRDVWNWRTLTSETEMCRMIELFFTLPPAELDATLERER